MSTSFEYRHQARIALATRIAKDAMQNALSHCLFEQWKNVDSWLHSHILEAVRPFIESRDIDDVDVICDFSQYGKWKFKLKIIPTQYVTVAAQLQYGIDLGEEK